MMDGRTVRRMRMMMMRSRKAMQMMRRMGRREGD